MSTAKIEVREADLDDETDIERLFQILDAYARGPGGMNAPIGAEARRNLGPGLRGNPNAFVLFASIDGGAPIGAAVCVWGFATFSGKPMVNLHDFSVLPEAQSKGVGSALMAELERRARDRGCGKVTLEVHESNVNAQRLYERVGFEKGAEGARTFFLTRPL